MMLLNPKKLKTVPAMAATFLHTLPNVMHHQEEDSKANDKVSSDGVCSSRARNPSTWKGGQEGCGFRLASFT